MGSDAPDEWEDYTDEQLKALEESLYDDEVNGQDVWYLRDKILWEMNRRRLCDGQ